MRDSIAALYELADRYSVPHVEIAEWLEQAVSVYCSSYTISPYELSLFKESLKDIEEVHFREAKIQISEALPFERYEQTGVMGKTVTLKVRTLK